MKRKMSVSEFSALRAEINTRFSTGVSLCNTALVISCALWTLILTHISTSADTANLNEDGTMLYCLFMPLITMVVILIPAVIYTENVHQISVLASYIVVFYEYPSIASIDEGVEYVCWEYTQIKPSHLSAKRFPSHLYKLFYHFTFGFLSLVNIIIFLHLNGFLFRLPRDPLFAKEIVFIVMLLILLVIGKMTYDCIRMFDAHKRKGDIEAIVQVAKQLGVLDSYITTEDVMDFLFGRVEC